MPKRESISEFFAHLDNLCTKILDGMLPHGIGTMLEYGVVSSERAKYTLLLFFGVEPRASSGRDEGEFLGGEGFTRFLLESFFCLE